MFAVNPKCGESHQIYYSLQIIHPAAFAELKKENRDELSDQTPHRQYHQKPHPYAN